jgi:hypothetical protein
MVSISIIVYVLKFHKLKGVERSCGRWWKFISGDGQ